MCHRVTAATGRTSDLPSGCRELSSALSSAKHLLKPLPGLGEEEGSTVILG